MDTKKIDESGAARHSTATVTIKADPLEIEVDPLELGKAPAEAMAKSIADGIRGVTAKAAPSTLRKRRAKGIASDRRWNASGELTRSVKAERDGDGYAISVLGDRLHDPGMLDRLAKDVPAVDNPVTPEVDAAIEHVADEMIRVRR